MITGGNISFCIFHQGKNMSISITIGSDPQDIDNLRKIKFILNTVYDSDLEQTKDWINSIYELLTEDFSFASIPIE